MQKGRILLTFFFFVFFLLFISLSTFFLLNANFSRKSLEVQKVSAQISELKIKPTITPTPTFAEIKIITRSSAKLIEDADTLRTEIPNANLKPKSSSPTDYILEKVNDYRLSQGLPRAYPNSETCAFAQIRAQEISSAQSFNHDGFTSRLNAKTLPYPSYSQVTENIAYNTDYKDVVNKWIQSPGHADNMQKGTMFVCIGNYGDYYAYEGWRP